MTDAELSTNRTDEPGAPERQSPREAILSAATRLFGEHGYEGTSIRDIAKAVGILHGSLYAHISSKQSVLLEIIESGVDRFNAAVDGVAMSDYPPDLAIREAIREHLQIVAENPERTLIVFHQWRFLNEENQAGLLEKRTHYSNFYTNAIIRGMKRGIFDPDLDPKISVLTMLGALNWTPEWFSPSGSASPAQVADRIADTLLRGLLTK